ncbi:hypothetical protein QLQ12_12860 [Actinoplanes sp. NEAU-A12]|uniref:DUF6891 domain-containing protein n=1 Tax=Actinoplanes sandaracinus TaxID=3045177 RepID=A0ABT6WIC5_9ACTN|nr:hypothetical protein [Actinoplanes sandaracinus]MDI6099486.1 hypothetical protein [Actinoplanes sandaracinus]
MTAWPYNDRPDGVRFLPDRVDEEARAEIEDEIWTWIVRGEVDAGEFVDYLDDGEENHGLTGEEITSAYEKALDVRRSQQRAWGDVRGNLTLAFAELNRIGVLARENFTCCGTCAGAEIHGERDGSRHWHGYVWYHQQDTESLISSPGGAVYLGYGAYRPDDLDQAAYDALSEDEKEAWYQAEVERLLDERVFPVLRGHGMEVQWNRSLATRVLVTGARWYAPLI